MRLLRHHSKDSDSLKIFALNRHLDFGKDTFESKKELIQRRNEIAAFLLPSLPSLSSKPSHKSLKRCMATKKLQSHCPKAHKSTNISVRELCLFKILVTLLITSSLIQLWTKPHSLPHSLSLQLLLLSFNQ
jgi:hypothetical protein